MKSIPGKIAVLGGSGFIGTRLVNRLNEERLDFRIGDIAASIAFPDRHLFCDVRRGETLGSVLDGCTAIINLAAEHRDDVRPVSRYHETNVEGASQVCEAARNADIRTIIFTSSVAVYGFHSFAVNESGPLEPFNPYGETKRLAEEVYCEWAREDPSRHLVIIRPTVVFGEGNRGNVYNLLRQIAAGRFLMIGKGINRKSMAYVGNVADSLIFSLSLGAGTHIFNYVDTPDMDMNELVAFVMNSLCAPPRFNIKIPVPLAMLAGYIIDAASSISGHSFPISSIRIRKFCEQTQFSSEKIREAGFLPRYSLSDGLKKTISFEFDGHREQGNS